MEIRPVGAVIHEERRTAMTKLIGAFHDHAANASEDDSAMLQKERIGLLIT